MNKSKIILFWSVCYILSLASFILAFPILLLTLFPYSIFIVGVYSFAIFVLSMLCFQKNALEKRILKKVLFGVLLVPVIALLAILISMGAGWLHFPG